MEQRDVRMCVSVLNCKIMTIPFVYLGVSIGADARKLSTWQPVIDNMRAKLVP